MCFSKKCTWIFSLSPSLSLFNCLLGLEDDFSVLSHSGVTNSAPTEDQRASQPKDCPSYTLIRVRPEDRSSDTRFVLLSFHRKKNISCDLWICDLVICDCLEIEEGWRLEVEGGWRLLNFNSMV